MEASSSGLIARGVSLRPFKLPFGKTFRSVYFETHHVVPLAEGGADHESNVVALCANDHPRAHFAEIKDEISGQLLAKVCHVGDIATPRPADAIFGGHQSKRIG